MKLIKRKIRSHSYLLLFVLNAFNSTTCHAYTFDGVYSSLGGADVTVFNDGGQLPGSYLVDVILNGEVVDTREVSFSLSQNSENQSHLTPCLDINSLQKYGVKVENYPELDSGVVASDSTDICSNLSAIPQATYKFKLNNQELLISIPQIAIREKLKGIANQDLWDDGIPALIMNYNISGTYIDYNREKALRSDYIQINPGLNLGAWRLRSSSYWSQSNVQPMQFKRNYLYLDRGLYGIKSRFAFGELYTPGEIFESTPFTGVVLESDETMIPSNAREFAPIIRGVAKTDARIEVKQNDYIIYSANIAPGPFSLDNLNVGGGASSNLQVTLFENDGSQQILTIPYTTSAIAVRKGYHKYNLTFGSYRPSNNDIYYSNFAQATTIYGLPWDLTAYAGVQSSKDFQSVLSGVGASLGSLGAMSFDVTSAKGQRERFNEEAGTATRLRYNKTFDTTRTGLSLSKQNYTQHYNKLSDILDRNIDNNYIVHANFSERRKTENTINLNQSIGSNTSIGLSFYDAKYWNSKKNDQTIGAISNLSFYGTSLSLSLSKSFEKNAIGNTRNELVTSFSASFPLDFMFAPSTRATFQLTSPSNGIDTYQLRLSGQSYEKQLAWNVYNSGGEGLDYTNGLNSTWYGSNGQFSGGYSYNKDYRQMGGDLSGSVVIHSRGITLGQTLGDTVALIEAQGSVDTSVLGEVGVKTDSKGFALKTYLSPYQINYVSLNPLSIPTDAEITKTDIKVVPTKGGLVKAKFLTRTGDRALVTISTLDGNFAPFGAIVKVSKNKGEAGIVGENGEVYLTGLPKAGTLDVAWGKNKNQTCKAVFSLNNLVKTSGMFTTKLTCR